MSDLLGNTNNYKFNLVNFNITTWHDYEYDNWRSVDALLSGIISIPGYIGIWQNSTLYPVGSVVSDADDNTFWECSEEHTSADSGTTFSQDRTANPTYWTRVHLTTTDVHESVIGKQSIWISAGAIAPTVTDGCATLATIATSANRPDITSLDFDGTSIEYAQFSISFPKQWNEGTITYQIFWSSASANSTSSAWNVQGLAVNNDDRIEDTDYGTAVTVIDGNLGVADELLVTDESDAITLANTPDENALCFFRLYRDPTNGSDNMTEDARLLGIKLYYTTDAANDE